jgi:DNA-binding transcriptional ArsR family regulator
MTEFSDARKVAALLAAVAEPTRLRVLWQLARGPQNVGTLADLVKIPMVNMSHHLGVMRQAGILDDEKDGRKVIYKLRPGVFTPSTEPNVLGVLTLGPFRVVLWIKGEPPPVTTSSKSRRKAAKSSGK